MPSTMLGSEDVKPQPTFEETYSLTEDTNVSHSILH